MLVVSPPNWQTSPGRTKQFLVITEPKLNFKNSRQACERLGGNAELATITNAADEEFIGTLVPDTPKATRFIGLQRKRKEKFKWTKGGIGMLRITDYAGWFPGMPGLALNTRKLKCVGQETRMINGVARSGWVLINCRNAHRYICERPVPK
jgi:hypothetical protein